MTSNQGPRSAMSDLFYTIFWPGASAKTTELDYSYKTSNDLAENDRLITFFRYSSSHPTKGKLQAKVTALPAGVVIGEVGEDNIFVLEGIIRKIVSYVMDVKVSIGAYSSEDQKRVLNDLSTNSRTLELVLVPNEHIGKYSKVAGIIIS